jgi:hypothetical protein
MDPPRLSCIGGTPPVPDQITLITRPNATTAEMKVSPTVLKGLMGLTPDRGPATKRAAGHC